MISILDSNDTEQADLRGGRSPWGQHPVSLSVHESMKCDALIVGGSTAASTSMLL